MTAAATCRSCESPRLSPVLDLGRMALADALVKDLADADREPKYPLEVAFCEDCSLLQILETVPPEILYCQDYPYYSSFIETVLENARQNVRHILATRTLSRDSLVVELASNDGYLLRNFLPHGIPVLGIDPAEGPARAAEEAGVPTLCTFFDGALAERLKAEGRQADVIFGNNVLAHVGDTNAFVAAIGVLLKPSGVVVIEVPYVRDLVDHCEFDTIYHEHHCYFSVISLRNLFRRHGLFVNDVKRIPIHGGSLRIFVEHEDRMSDAARRLLDEERALGLDRFDYYADFARRVTALKESLVGVLQGLKAEGKSIAAYGAAAKGTTLLNYMNIGPRLIDYVVDRNVHKHGRYMPGQHLPICPPDRLLQDRPDYLMILAWNHAAEIMNQCREYARRGGRFIIPIPEPKIV